MNSFDIRAAGLWIYTNFGKAHLEGFGGVEGVIKGKKRNVCHLKPMINLFL